MVIPKPTFKADFITFADGGEAGLVDTYLKEEDGILFRYFEMKPTSWLRYDYQIHDRDLDKDRYTITCKYKADLCVHLKETPDNQRWFLLQTYDGKERVDLISRFNKGLLEQNRILLQEINLCKIRERKLKRQMEDNIMFDKQKDRYDIEKALELRMAFGRTNQPKEDETNE